MNLRKTIGYFRVAGLTTLFALGGIAWSYAQTGGQIARGALHGQVDDSFGGAVAKATVAVVSASGQSVAATSNADGTFDVKDLAPGSYSVRVNATGFSPYQNNAVQIVAGQTLQLTVSLMLQTQEQQVTVSADSPKALDVAPANNASALVLREAELAALPDDPDELLADLQALAGPSTGPNGGQLYIDGFTAGQLPPKSAIREIRVNQNPFSAQYDKVGYGRIEVFTKPGTDKWHGQVFVNANNSVLNTKNPFSLSKGNFQSTQLNGNVSGPLNKNASVSLNVDYRDIHDVSVVSAFTGLDGSGDPIAFSQSVANPRTRLNISPRLDYQLTKTNTLSVRYQYFLNTEMDNGIGGTTLATAGYNTHNIEHTLQISDTQVLSTKIINETRFQFLRDDNSQTALQDQTAIMVLGAFTGGGSNQGNIFDNGNHYELQNYTSISLAKHYVKFGGRLRILTESNSSTSRFNGLFTFPTLTAFANSMPTQFSFTAGLPAAHISAEDVGLYVEDDWKIRPNLTFSYGLRLESQNHISDHLDWAPRLAIAWGLGNSKMPPKTVLRGGFGIFYDRFNAPQILQAARQGLEDPLQEQFIITSPSAMLFNDCSTSISAPSCQGDIAASSASSSVPTFYQIAPNLHAPYTVQLGASVERQLSKIANMSVSYLHSSGYDQLFTNNVNTPSPGKCDPVVTPGCVHDVSARPNGIVENIYQYQSQGIFRQNQLIVSMNVRAGAKLTLGGYYTLNFANSDTAGIGSFPSNPFDIMADYGRASFDIRHRVYFGGSTTLPFGIRLSPFLIASSGAPYNITLGQDLIGSTQFNQRPAFASCPAGGSVVSTPVGCFDTRPSPGETLVPINSLTAQAHFTLNLRVSKTFAFGSAPAANDTNPRPRRGPGGGGPPGGGGGGGGGRRGGAAPPPGGGGPGGGAAVPGKRYSITLSANARNIFNVVNLGVPLGNIGSPLFTHANGLAGGAYSSAAANRQIFLQMQFAF